ncbi:MAG TPA: hypothetical protein VGH90_04885, partial [Chthoniobacteraceae bacterium]
RRFYPSVGQKSPDSCVQPERLLENAPPNAPPGLPNGLIIVRGVLKFPRHSDGRMFEANDF